MASPSRRRGREAALRAIYMMEFSGAPIEEALADTAEQLQIPELILQFTTDLLQGTVQRRRELDARLSELIPNWDFDRLAATDRNVLRLAAYELAYMPTIPPAVTINEAVSIAKKYGTEDSGKFVNGVLAKFLTKTDKANWVPPVAEPLEEEPDELLEDEALPEVEMIEAGTDAEAELKRVGAWKIKVTPRNDSPDLA